MAAPDYVKNTLKFWLKEEIKESTYINSLVSAGKLTQAEADEILNAV